MKQIKYLMLLSLFAILITSCERNPICPDEPNYHFFTGDELNLLWENVDSALILQDKLNSGEIGSSDINSDYGKIDTIQFINQSYDTLNFVYIYKLTSGNNQWCANDIPMIAKSSLYFIEENFIEEIEIKLEKATDSKLIYNIEFLFNEGQDFSSNFSLTDSIKIDYNVFNSGMDASTIIYLKAYISNYQFNNENLNNCLIFEFNTQSHIEKFKVIYSNKYGYLKLIKNENYEIERIL